MRIKHLLIAASASLLMLAACSKEEPAPAVTTVDQSSESPTGYFVTFRYQAPDAELVKVKGEWLFSHPEDAGIKTSTNAGPFEWENGDTVWSTVDYPSINMTKNEETGIWECRIPLPSGTYKYKFYVDGKEAWDPAHLPYARDLNATDLKGEDTYSAVYVPYDPERQSKSFDYSDEAPLDGFNGSVSFVNLQSERTGRLIKFGVYLPFGFDPERAEKYPVLILQHGGGGTESSWFNNGAAHILDNLIHQGRMIPTVVITPNGSDFGWNREEIDDAYANDILPYAEQHYNISTDVHQRAMAGLSMGGATVMYTFINHPEIFDYYLSMSAPVTKDINMSFDNPSQKEKSLCITMGMFDFVKVESILNLESRQAKGGEGSVYSYIYGMQKDDIPFKTSFELPYGHQWVLWRQNLVFFADKILWK